MNNNKEAEKAFNEYLETRQFVTHKEMEAWLKSWGTDKEAACPKLHC